MTTYPDEIEENPEEFEEEEEELFQEDEDEMSMDEEVGIDLVDVLTNPEQNFDKDPRENRSLKITTFY